MGQYDTESHELHGTACEALQGADRVDFPVVGGQVNVLHDCKKM